MSPHRQLTSDNTNTKIKIKTKLDDFDIKLSKAHIWLVKANLQRGKASTCPDFRVEIPHSYILTQMITQFTFICDFFFIFFSQNLHSFLISINFNLSINFFIFAILFIAINKNYVDLLKLKNNILTI